MHRAKEIRKKQDEETMDLVKQFTKVRGCLLDAYSGKRLPMPFTLLIKDDEDQKTYPVKDTTRN